MQLANAWLRVHKDGTVPLYDITPAEAVVLNTAHLKNANGIAVSQIEITKDITRANAIEIQRLRGRYPMLRDTKNTCIVDVVYPGVNPTLPKTFKEAGIAVPSGASIEVPDEPEPAPVRTEPTVVKK